ncbi:type I DNA topoisomerase [bacterium]|nr:type I DNA topoisomerase [bacterium]
MAKSLVVVESPAKAKTINKYLGGDYVVKACMGHIKDLPKSKLGVDEEKDFEPHYVIIRGKNDIVKDLQKAAQKAKKIYLAPDPDREGEAIAAHLAEELQDGKPVHRVILNEITKEEVKNAFANPTVIDEKKVQAQQTRRILDRLVGYKLSPLLWQKVKRGLSAGRVQSIALRLICDREREILAFVPEEYWILTAFLEADEPPVFAAKLLRKDGKKLSVADQQTSDQILADLQDAVYTVKEVEKKQRKRHAPAPYITSKLQQEASRKFRWPVKKVMMVAQELYEGIEVGEEGAVGLITYMRTDSVRISEQALQEGRKYVHDEYGREYLPDQPNFFKNKKSVQDAHEAIRPTSAHRTPDSVKHYLSRDEYKLYQLIWNRFVASQMKSAEFDETIITVSAKDFEFEASGQVMTFAGYLKVYQETEETESDQGPSNLPPVEVGQRLRLDRLEPKQNFTQPPPRFTEAALVKELEDKEIGRPSTYASIISVIQNRNYVIKEENRFKPTDLGLLISDLLVQHFDELMDFKYTAHLEEELDEIEEGSKVSLEVLNEFYGDFTRDLKKAYDLIENIKATGIATDLKCPQCQSPMVKRWGKFGAFLACTNEECKYTQNPDEKPGESIGDVGSESEHVCLKCGKPLVVKVGRYGKFLACSGYPECKFTATLTPSKTAAEGTVEVPGEKCPQCGSELVVKQGRFGPFIACSNYPDCKYIKPKTVDVKCPEDGGDLVEKRTRGRKIFYGCSNYPDCKFAVWYKPIPQECPVCHAPFMLEKYRKDQPSILECYNKECKFQLEPVPAEP